jgi:hypothetical protein
MKFTRKTLPHQRNQSFKWSGWSLDFDELEAPEVDDLFHPFGFITKKI